MGGRIRRSVENLCENVGVGRLLGEAGFHHKRYLRWWPELSDTSGISISQASIIHYQAAPLMEEALFTTDQSAPITNMSASDHVQPAMNVEMSVVPTETQDTSMPDAAVSNDFLR